MDIIIVFFRDILSGPLYYIMVAVNCILICACIGYIGEAYVSKKKWEKMTYKPVDFSNNSIKSKGIVAPTNVSNDVNQNNQVNVVSDSNNATQGVNPPTQP